MATFIFLHGSFHAAWNWHKVIPLLSLAGHSSIALDLPGHGRDETPANRVFLSTYVEAVIDCVQAQKDGVVLVAHSRNGIVISQVAERVPHKIRGLIYLAAYLVPDGKSMMDYAVTDDESLVVANTELALNRKYLPMIMRIFRSELIQRVGAFLLPLKMQSHRLRRSTYRAALYHDCDDSIVELANVLLEKESNWAGFSPMRLSKEMYGTVRKVYIECLQDRAVTLPLQRLMLAKTPCDFVYSMDTSHSPFFSAPELLTEHLIHVLTIFTPDTLTEPNGVAI